MKAILFTGIAALILVLVGLSLFAPVSASDADNKTWITATVSPSAGVVGDPVTVWGTVTPPNATQFVKIWIFAGNYANVTQEPVNVSGYFSRTYDSTGLPAAYYYVFIQTLGADNTFNIDLKGYSGQVVNEKTGQVVFTFTGNGSVQDNSAAIALSNAFAMQGVDDVFTKTGFSLVDAAAGTATAATTSSAATSLPATTKTPLTVISVLAAAAIASLAACRVKR